MMDKYAHIIDLPHHVSKVRPQMTMYQRAAQFAPFAALTGHSAAISETARLTDKVIELSESECEVLNQKITLLLAHLDEHPYVCITYFVPDHRRKVANTQHIRVPSSPGMSTNKGLPSTTTRKSRQMKSLT